MAQTEKMEVEDWKKDFVQSWRTRFDPKGMPVARICAGDSLTDAVVWFNDKTPDAVITALTSKLKPHLAGIKGARGYTWSFALEAEARAWCDYAATEAGYVLHNPALSTGWSWSPITAMNLGPWVKIAGDSYNRKTSNDLELIRLVAASASETKLWAVCLWPPKATNVDTLKSLVSLQAMRAGRSITAPGSGEAFIWDFSTQAESQAWGDYIGLRLGYTVPQASNYTQYAWGSGRKPVHVAKWTEFTPSLSFIDRLAPSPTSIITARIMDTGGSSASRFVTKIHASADIPQSTWDWFLRLRATSTVNSLDKRPTNQYVDWSFSTLAEAKGWAEFILFRIGYTLEGDPAPYAQYEWAQKDALRLKEADITFDPNKETNMSDPTPTTTATSRPSTASRLMHAGKEAAIGGTVTETQRKILKLIKDRVKVVHKDLPDHPFYDKLIIAALSMGVMEAIRQWPGKLPFEDSIWTGCDAALHYQAHNEAKDLFNLVQEGADEILLLLGGLGSSVSRIEAQTDLGGMEDARERPKARAVEAERTAG